jgi:hypothetical protein
LGKAPALLGSAGIQTFAKSFNRGPGARALPAESIGRDESRKTQIARAQVEKRNLPLTADALRILVLIARTPCPLRFFLEYFQASGSAGGYDLIQPGWEIHGK